jgi:hypothetical protein
MSVVRRTALIATVAVIAALAVPLSPAAAEPATYVLTNGAIRFGNGGEDSVNGSGTLQQPWYYSGDAQQWFKLTYSSYPLDQAIGTGTGGANWSGSTVEENPGLAGQVIDYSGYTTAATDGVAEGTGTVVSTGTSTVNGQDFTVRNEYTLLPGALYVKVVTRLTNLAEDPATNVNLWVGTRDDWVGRSDGPTKTKGTLVDGAFVAISDPTTPANALRITSGAEGVLFYTTTPGANTAINWCCSFSNAYETDPVASSITETGDGSYAINLPAGTIAAGASTELTWFYAAGSLADLDDAVSQVAAASAPAADPGNGTVTLTWTAPASTDPITNYAIRWSDDGGQTWTELPLRDPSTSTTEVITGLTNGTTYQFQIAAITGTAPDTIQGPWSSTSNVTIPGAPLPPTLVSAVDSATSSVVTFTASGLTDPDAPVTAYEYQLGSGAWTAIDPFVAGGEIEITGLTTGTAYVLRLRARNAYGVSDASSSIGLHPFGVPDEVDYLDPWLEDATLWAEWDNPDDNGAPITDYDIAVSADDGDTWTTLDDGTSDDTEFSWSDGEPGTSYLIRVRARNAAGPGPWSSPEGPITIPDVPDQVDGLAAVSGAAQVELTWEEPEDNGSSISDYVVERSLDQQTWTVVEDDVSDDTELTVTGLDNGTEYWFRVAAVNDVGTGAESDPVGPVVPVGLASAPGTPSGTSGDFSVLLTWSAPESDGGSPVTEYAVEQSTDAGTSWQPSTVVAASGAWVAHAAALEPTAAMTGATVTGLTNGVSHRFRVRAITAWGPGAWSSASDSVVPRRVGPVITVPTTMALTVGTRAVMRPSVYRAALARQYLVRAGTLPPGMSIDPASGLVSGVPQARGTWRFKVAARDQYGRVFSSAYVTVTSRGSYVAYFLPGSRTLDRADRLALQKAAAASAACPTCTVTVRGYAAYIAGGRPAALTIARLRARSVVAYLRSQGVRAEITSLVVVGYDPHRTGDKPMERKATVTIAR